jgi:hypothetical protein
MIIIMGARFSQRGVPVIGLAVINSSSWFVEGVLLQSLGAKAR